MHRRLISHPTTPCEYIDSVDVHLHADETKLLLRYEITGAIDSILLPALTVPERRDGLWQHTCFELLARSARARSYIEFNFSPSTCWAAYEFDDYRSGMRPLAYLHAPLIRRECETGTLTLETEVELVFTAAATLDLFSLAAVIEDTEQHKSYWALTHPMPQPDFHHPDAFTLAIAPGVSR